MKTSKSPLNPNTRIKVVNGCKFVPPYALHHCHITVYVTDDKRGKSMSLADGSMMLTIPLEEVEDLLTVVHKEEGE